jgi:hypothetical protein
MGALQWLRNGGNLLVRVYVRHTARFVAAGAVWWIAYVVFVELVLGDDLPTAFDKALRVTFAIVSPHEAVTFAWQASHPNVPTPSYVSAVGWMGWSVIIYFTLMIPGLVASMIERLPALATSVSSLMTPEVSGFVEPYSKSLGAFMKAMMHDTAAVDDETRSLFVQARLRALLAVATLVRSWYLDETEKLHANASFMRLIPGSKYPNPAVTELYSKKPVSQYERVLELDGWAKPDDMPATLFLAVDERSPYPGAPKAVVDDEPSGISDTRSESEWRAGGVSDATLKAVVAYFKTVPFRSFISVPVHEGEKIIGVVSMQVDQPNKLVLGNGDTSQLVALVQPICYFLAWIERKTR